MHIHFIQHEIFEAPGAFISWSAKHGYKTSFSRVFDGESLPVDTESIDLLVVLGGPQDPSTTLADCPHFDAAAEIALIKQCIYQGKAIVGVCLGSQLIGNAFGAPFEHSPEKEIGVFPIELTKDGLHDEKLKDFGSSLLVGHWHNDMPGLTSDCKVLATSKGCPRQIIAYSDLVYGFQCHLELTSEVVELLIESDKEILENYKQYKFVQSPDTIQNYNYSEMNNKLHSFLDKLVEEYKRVHKYNR